MEEIIRSSKRPPVNIDDAQKTEAFEFMIKTGASAAKCHKMLVEKYKDDAINIGKVNSLSADVKSWKLSHIKLLKGEEYLKDTILEEDRILENSKLIEEATMARQQWKPAIESQEVQLRVLDQRARILGLDKQGVSVNININSNVSENDFLKSQNIVNVEEESDTDA